MRSIKKNYLFLILFIYLLSVGIFLASIIPIFENFDEPSHFSYIRQLAFSPNPLAEKKIFMDQNILRYTGPSPYASGLPPYDNSSTYKNFLSSKEKKDAFREVYKANAFSNDYLPSESINFEGQHPPFYYYLISTIYLKITNLSLSSQVICIRVLSYLFSLIGIFSGFYAFKKHLLFNKAYSADSIPITFFMYTLLFPMFFLEFSRIGNDSLCILLLGILVNLVLSFIKKNTLATSFLIGLTLSAGLFTKAFYFPICLATVIYLSIFLTRKRISALKYLLVIMLPIISLGLFWYVNKFLESGNFLGFGLLSQSNNHISSIFDLPLSNFYLLLKGVLSIFITFIWAGTWSLVHLPFWAYLPSLFFILYIFLQLFKLHLRFNFESLHFYYILSGAFFLFGLLWHLLKNYLILNLSGINTPGWYLHVLAPLAIFSYIIIFDNAFKKKAFYFYSFISSSIFFMIYALWSEITLFSGCSYKSLNKHFEYQSNNICLDKFPEVLGGIELLANTQIAVLSFIIALLSFIVLFRASSNYYLNGKILRDTLI
ncbi:hypothetical protein FIT72_04095 [Candidatus Methylopumilus universalis]|jgi:hypothetical protein|uniref:hypothetical protein n=1 Tax=Candidatus Methylopumilus universalis TaxID=2588536 RepID=UPI00111DE47F|nr:hypothetical protein [Candidatus Methylopumilus universalis]QDC70731.1 hypothetical protein FIT72_04095 [Candidatus Methylopumilus universalis]